MVNSNVSWPEMNRMKPVDCLCFETRELGCAVFEIGDVVLILLCVCADMFFSENELKKDFFFLVCY